MKTTEATGRVKLALARLADHQPLSAGILARWTLTEDDSVETMAVGLRNGRLRLRFSPSFVGELTMDELSGVLHHEANHVLFGHVLHEPDPGENRNARIIAEEVTCNEWVLLPLPGDPILLSNFPFLSANEDTDTRYDRLIEHGKLHKPKPLDDHDGWQELTADPELGAMAVQMAVGMAWDSLPPDQKAKLSPEVRAQVGKACGGGLSGNPESLTGGRSSIPWQTVLRRYVGKTLTVRPVFGRPPRRFPELVGVLPGRGRFRGKPHVMAVIDTSGSLSGSDLADISEELAHMARTYRVTVVECDDRIHAVYPYSRPITDVHGRGGTDLRPPFAPEILRQHRPDLVVYFTDGCGPAPEKKPSVPVIWAVTAAGKAPTQWGKAVRMTGKKVHAPAKTGANDDDDTAPIVFYQQSFSGSSACAGAREPV